MNVCRSCQVPLIVELFNKRRVRSGLPQRTCFLNWLLLLIVCFSVLIEISLAQESTPINETEEKSQVIDQPDPNVEAHEVSRLGIEKRKKAFIGLAAIGGIAILGTSAIAMTMLWARRLRRLARDLGPPQKTAGNDFWFLKPPKPIVSEINICESHRSPHPPPSTESPETNE